ncbi:PTS sugar transporter subunit IIA [Listeria booriae]|uniref:PTS sugar transporter subunit IIA n=1 Tax=Listeria booriae TaxID=1552123 RepID=UPI001625504B|nr:PTS sugar transporter subunit IIA [Listeria booriae]MBC1898390.1 PTS sugar transporter subunit IIA [Listeria booriae]MBC2265387.1 PTS sugar transporter subunit IIA [Listeria booriae]
MDLTQFITKDMIWVQTPCQDQDALFEMVSERAASQNRISNQFLERLTEREAVFPTGLQLEHYGVALPHTDPECVTEQFIAVLTSEAGIRFKQMADASQETAANLIFVLGLNEPHSQLAVLQQLMGAIQNEEHVKALLAAKNEDEVIETLSQVVLHLKGEEKL